MRHLYANRSRALGRPATWLGRAPAHEFYRGPSSSSWPAGSRARLSRHREARLPLPRTTPWPNRVKNPTFRSIRCSCTSAPRPDTWTPFCRWAQPTWEFAPRLLFFIREQPAYPLGADNWLLGNRQFGRICWFLVFVGCLETWRELSLVSLEKDILSRKS